MQKVLPSILMEQLEEPIWKHLELHNALGVSLRSCPSCSSYFSIIEAYDAFYFDRKEE